ncbi:MAG: alpha/beta hydrolase [Clostridia bacterium]|nr:alpha/beta hydrolase [Clostridia bacterium]
MKKIVIEPALKAPDKLDKVISDHYRGRKGGAPSKIGPVIRGIDVGVFRYPDTHPSYELVDLAKDVKEEDMCLGSIPYRVYTAKDASKNAPCFVYVHGGGFMMGALDRLNNINRRFAEVLHGVAVHIDYTMSPEAAYPTAVDQCYFVIEELAANAEKYGIDPGNITVMGDSAGGNITLSMGLKDKGRGLIKNLVVYYPVVDLSSYSYEKFDMSMMGEDLDPMVVSKITSMWKGNAGSTAVGSMAGAYLHENTPADDFHVSPLLAPKEELAGMARTILLTAEFDFLRIQCEELLQKMEDAGVSVEYYMYAGTFHGFLERLGVFEESDHSIRLVAERILA